MKDHIVRRLRECAAVYGKQRTWISELSDEQLYQIFLKIRAGENGASIARFCQEHWGVRQDSTIHSLKQGVLKFQKRIAHLLLATPIAPTPTTLIDNREIVSDNSLESLEQNEIIATQLRRRIRRMIREEEEFGFSNQNLCKEVLALTTLDKAILKQKEWILRHPEHDPVQRLMDHRREAILTQSFNRFMANTTPQGRDNVILAAERFLELCEEKAILVPINDITYSNDDTSLVNDGK